MGEENHSKPRVLLPLISFGITLLMAMIVMVATAVIALAELLSHAWLAALIVAALLLLMAWLIYVVWARATIEYIDKRLDTVYDVASAARNDYLVANASAIVAWWNGTKHGGTAYTVKQARKAKILCYNLCDRELPLF